MVFITKEGQFNANSYMFDGFLYNRPKNVSIYVIENNGMRMMIDTGVTSSAKT